MTVRIVLFDADTGLALRSFRGPDLDHAAAWIAAETALLEPAVGKRLLVLDLDADEGGDAWDRVAMNLGSMRLETRHTPERGIEIVGVSMLTDRRAYRSGVYDYGTSTSPVRSWRVIDAPPALAHLITPRGLRNKGRSQGERIARHKARRSIAAQRIDRRRP